MYGSRFNLGLGTLGPSLRDIAVISGDIQIT